MRKDIYLLPSQHPVEIKKIYFKICKPKIWFSKQESVLLMHFTNVEDFLECSTEIGLEEQLSRAKGSDCIERGILLNSILEKLSGLIEYAQRTGIKCRTIYRISEPVVLLHITHLYRKAGCSFPGFLPSTEPLN